MAKSTGDTISEIDYNGLQSDINVIMGTPAGSTDTTATGYLQSLSSSQVAVGDKVTDTQWDNLRTDITKAYTHQFGVSPTITNVDESTVISASIFNQYETLITTVSGDPNRYTIGSGQFTIVAGQTGTLASGWNGTQIHQFTATFSSANQRKAFFNAGGAIRINLSLSYTGSEAKTLDWQTMMSDLGTVEFNYKQTTGGGGSTIGNYDATSTFQQIATEAGSNPYSENDIFVQVKENSATQLEFKVILDEEDSGDRPSPSPPPPFGPLVDEPVKGTTTSSVTIKQPTGSNVSVPAPTIAAASGNTFST